MPRRAAGSGYSVCAAELLCLRRGSAALSVGQRLPPLPRGEARDARTVHRKVSCIIILCGLFKLAVVQLCVEAAGGHQLLVSAALNNVAIVFLFSLSRKCHNIHYFFNISSVCAAAPKRSLLSQVAR